MIVVERRKLTSVFLFNSNSYMWPADGQYTWRLSGTKTDMSAFLEVGTKCLVRWQDE
jgi:hypothetical protein